MPAGLVHENSRQQQQQLLQHQQHHHSLSNLISHLRQKLESPGARPGHRGIRGGAWAVWATAGPSLTRY
ncbi:hypothetical protein IF1G_00264 [Cordyceps javanica]|uniref:Uncharacterized protein n=1 Tax=Cordyceps javanica TaxID=43265 RepID=A0A545VF29_9HYPO|nr:hypothetical protein IF1G_00264 [Cordyceps javanica]